MGIKKPNIKYTPTDISGTINIKAKSNEAVTDDYGLKPDQQVKVTKLVTRLYDVAERLHNIDEVLEEKLENCSIPYDPHQHPLLDEAVKCKYCGNPKAQSVLNAESDKNKEEAEKKINAYLSSSLGLDGKTVDPVAIASKQQKTWVDMLSSIITDLIKQIVSIVLKAINSILSLIPGVGSLLSSITSKYRTKALSLSNVYGDLFNDGVSQDLVELEEENVELDDEGFNLYKNCAEHINNYKKYSNILISTKTSMNDVYSNSNTSEEVKHEQIENIKNSHMENYRAAKEQQKIAKDTYKNLVNMADKTIPSDFTFQVSNDKEGGILKLKKYNKDELLETANVELNNVDLMFDSRWNSEKGKESKANLYRFVDGLDKALATFQDNYLADMEDFLNEWWNDPDTICCLLKTLTDILKSNPDFFKWLKLIRELLNLYLAFKFDLDFSLRLSELSDIVKNLLKSLSAAIITAFSSISNLGIDAAMLKLTDAINSIPNKDCFPLDRLMYYISLSTKDLLSDIYLLFDSFIDKEIDLLMNLNDYTLKNKKQSELKGFLKIIDLLLNYALELEHCLSYTNYVSPYANKSKDFFKGSLNDVFDKISDNLKNTKFDTNMNINYQRYYESNDSVIFNKIYNQFLDLNIIGNKNSKVITREQLNTKAKECACSGELTQETLDRLKKILSD